MFSGIFLGILTYVSMVMTFIKWPDRLKRLALEHELITDILAGFSAWAILGLISKTLAAVAGAVVAEILLGVTLHYYKEQYDAGKVLQKPIRQAHIH